MRLIVIHCLWKLRAIVRYLLALLEELLRGSYRYRWCLDGPSRRFFNGEQAYLLNLGGY